MIAAVRRAAAAGVWIVSACAASAAAQSQAPPEAAGASRVELAAGLAWSGSTDLGAGAATLTPNLNRPAFSLFDVRARFQSPLGGEIRVAYRLTPWLMAGVAGTLLAGDVSVTIRNDAEGAAATTFPGERLVQAQVEGRLDLLVTRWRFAGGRALPFVMASAGILRHAHEGRVSIESGRIAQAGAGLRYTFAHRAGTWLPRMGVTAELRAARVRGGFHWGRESRTQPALVAGASAGWGR